MSRLRESAVIRIGCAACLIAARYAGTNAWFAWVPQPEQVQRDCVPNVQFGSTADRPSGRIRRQPHPTDDFVKFPLGTGGQPVIDCRRTVELECQRRKTRLTGHRGLGPPGRCTAAVSQHGTEPLGRPSCAKGLMVPLNAAMRRALNPGHSLLPASSARVGGGFFAFGALPD